MRYGNSQEIERPGTTFVPAVRTVVLHVGVHGEKSWTHIIPVLGMYTRLVDTYERTSGSDYRTTTPAEAKEAGYNFSHREVKTSALIAGTEFGIVPHDYVYFQSNNTADRVIACTWPPEEDETRLKDEAEQMIDDIRQTLKYQAERKAAEKVGAA
jgi:hypothetical protein